MIRTFLVCAAAAVLFATGVYVGDHRDAVAPVEPPPPAVHVPDIPQSDTITTPEMSDPNDPVVAEDRRLERMSTEEKMSASSAYQHSLAPSSTPKATAEQIAKWTAQPSQRKSRGGWARTPHQAVLLARIIASEDTCTIRPLEARCGTAGEFTADAHGIAEVIENNRGQVLYPPRKLAKLLGVKQRWAKSWDEVMGSLAPHVTRTVELTRPRQEWTSTLPETGCQQPVGWVPARDGDWRLYAEHWCTLRDATIYAWMNQTFEGVPGKPIAWGNEEDLINGIKNRGLCRVPGVGSRNGFLARPGDGCEPEEDPDLRVEVVLPEPVAVVVPKSLDVDDMLADVRKLKAANQRDKVAP